MLRSTLFMAAAIAGLASLSDPSGTAGPSEIVELPHPFAPALLSMPSRAYGEAVRGVAIIVPDVIGQDGRAGPYVEALLSHGIATMEIDVGGEGPRHPGDIEAALAVARQHLSRDAHFTALPVTVIGFGDGARAALAWAGMLPVVALYPHCASLPALPVALRAEERAPLLLLHPARGTPPVRRAKRSAGA
jgi:dienelactone hydrolase